LIHPCAFYQCLLYLKEAILPFAPLYNQCTNNREVVSMSGRKSNISLTLAGVLILISVGMLGCSDSGNDTKESAAPAKDTMPKVNTTDSTAKPEPDQQPAPPEEAPKTAAAEPAPAETTPPATAEPASPGEKVYKSACFACHATGVAGAPKLGDKALWKDRIAKGKDELVKNVINGYTGSTGVMPPKGGFTHLSDEEIVTAVDYMIDAAK
jgi:cytochrome c5